MKSEGDQTMTLTAPHRTPPLSVEVDGFDAAYRRLVDARLEYEVLKSRGAPTGALIEARAALHRIRAEMALHRRLDGII
jgi:hypothetical protein